MLKIIDFERAKDKHTEAIPGRGTRNYRAPEIRSRQCIIPKAADIYSAGVVLYLMVFHFHPYLEDRLVNGFDLHTMMLDGDVEYWDAIKECRLDVEIPSEEFKELFLGMVKRDPFKRLTLDEIKQSKWYQDEKLDSKELKRRMGHFRRIFPQ